jgi:hypothetical protein
MRARWWRYFSVAVFTLAVAAGLVAVRVVLGD